MKIQKKQILINIITLGYSGYKRAKKIFEENSLRERVLLSDQILGFMLVLPIIMAVTLTFGLIGSSELEGIGTDFFETVYFIFNCFMFFCLLHLFLGLALLQHTSGLKAGERACVLWFGLYALDWTPSDYLKPLDSALRNGNKDAAHEGNKA